MFRVRTLNKRVLAIVLSALMMFVLFPAAVFAEETTYTETLYLTSEGELTIGVGGVVLVQNTILEILGNGSYTFSGGTLTLNGVNFRTSAEITLDLSAYSSAVTLNLNGSNSFVSTYSSDNTTRGIYSNQAITITGSGSLTVTGGGSSGGYSSGIESNGDVTISGSAAVTATGGGVTSIYNSYGICVLSGNIIITGGSLTASGANYAINEDPATLPAVYKYKTSAAGDLISSTLSPLSDRGTYVYIESATGVTPTTYTFNKAVSSDTLFEIIYSLASGVSFNNIVKNGTTALAYPTEWWSVDDNTIEITSSYLMGLDVGTYTITLDTTADVDPTVTLTVTNVYDKGLVLNASGLLTYNGNTIPQNTPIEALGNGSYSFAGGTLTLNGVNFTTSADQALTTGSNISVLTLTGDNSLISASINGIGIYEVNNNLSIGGSGSLTVSGANVGIWLDTGNLTITGGTINANGGSTSIMAVGGINITGGTIKATSEVDDCNPNPTNGTSNVYLTTLTGLPANTAVTAFSKTYGITGVKTDADGKLYFYLPRAYSSEAISLTVGGTVYYGTIPAGNEEKTVAMSATLTKTESLVLSPTGKLTYGGIDIPLNTASPYLGGGQYTFAGSTLTLTNINFTTSAATAFYLFDHQSALTLQLNGANTFVSTYSGNAEVTFGIFADKAITVTGSGSLTATGGDTTTRDSNGIYTNSDFTVNSGSVFATGSSSTSDDSYGLTAYLGDIIFNGGTVIISGKTAAAYAGSIIPVIAAVDAANADGRTAVRIDNTEIDLSTVKYIKTYESEAEYLRDYPSVIPEPEAQEPESTTPSSTPSNYPPIPPISSPAPTNTPGYTQSFKTKSGVTSTVTVTEDGVIVEAGLNKSGSVNYEATAAAVKKAAEIAKANGETSITVAIPEGATGLSKSTVQKLVNAANGTKIVLALTSVENGEEVGSISLPINAKTGQILTGLYFETERIYSVQNYIARSWNSDILGAFETAQKGGWGAVATLSISVDKLGISADDGTKLYALIYDTKNKKWYQVKATIENGNVVVNTKRTGIVTIVTQKVK